MNLEFLETAEVIFDRGGYLLIFLTSFVESSPFGWITPGGLVLAIGGFFCSGGDLSLVYVILYGVMGTWLMQIFGYLVGKKYGIRVAKIIRQEKNAERANKIMKRQGALVMTTTLTSNITRFWVAFIAGTKNFNGLKFLQYSFVASVSWVLIWSVTGFVAGTGRGDIEKLIPRLGFYSWILLIVAVVMVIWASKREFDEYDPDTKAD